MILDLIGNTPLIKISRIAPASGAAVFAKAEFLNPSGSVKDRAAKAMIQAGIKEGKLTADKTIIDATSGNTGISYAMIGAALGYRVKLFLPANASPERKAILRAYGAEIVETSPLEGSDGAFLAAQAEAEAHPDLYFYPNQYHNEANWKAHYSGTGEEIWRQTCGRVTHFICGMGTSGTFIGTTKKLKEYKSDLRAVAVQPDSPFHGIEGTKHMASTLKPGFYDPALPDDFAEVSTEESYAMARRLAREEGVYAGISSGANAAAALRLAETLAPGAVVVTVLCDSGARYTADRFWGETTRLENGGGI
jgi:cysteine synthase B